MGLTVEVIWLSVLAREGDVLLSSGTERFRGMAVEADTVAVGGSESIPLGIWGAMEAVAVLGGSG